MLDDVLLLIRLEAQHCLSVALTDVTWCHLGTGEPGAKVGTISLTQTHSQPCYILFPGVSHQLPLDLCLWDWKTQSMNLFANSLIPAFPGEEDERLQQAQNSTKPLLRLIPSTPERVGGCERIKAPAPSTTFRVIFKSSLLT